MFVCSLRRKLRQNFCFNQSTKLYTNEEKYYQQSCRTWLLAESLKNSVSSFTVSVSGSHSRKMSELSLQQPNPWRRSLKTAVTALLAECGYHSADTLALETLLEMTEAYITEAGRSSAAFAELSGRTRVMPTDAVLALLEMGLDFKNLPGHANRESKSVINAPVSTPTPAPPKILQVGDKKKHPSHIPEHLPSFPDPHTYINTPCFKQPSNEYQLVREKAASQRRDVEVGLTKFIAKTGTTHSLFKDDISSFPLIACKPSPLPYLSALLPPETDSTEELTTGVGGHIASHDSLDPHTEGDTIDNPYLLPPKISKRKWCL